MGGEAVLIYSDCKYVVDTFGRGSEAGVVRHLDLWRRIWAAVAHLGGPGKVQVRRVFKSHVKAYQIGTGLMSGFHAYGNAAADVLAGEAAERVRVPDDVVDRLRRHDHVVSYYLRKLVETNIIALDFRAREQAERAKSSALPDPATEPKKEKREPQPALKPAQLIQLLGQQGHMFVLSKHRYRCDLCHRTAAAGSTLELRQLLTAGRCRGWSATAAYSGKHVLHSSHQLRSYRGVDFCTRCGGYSTGVPHRLKKPCAEPNAGSRNVLKRLAAGKTPVAKMRTWPAP